MHTKLTRFIDFFYPPFRRLVPQSLFRYFACGGGNVLFDWVLYFVFYNFIIRKQIIHLEIFDISPQIAVLATTLGIADLSPHIAALLFTFPITLLSGFYLARNISFSGSSLRGQVQLFRYVAVVIINLFINYFCLKILVEWWHIYPTPSKMITTVFTTMFGYFAQKHYIFKKKKT